MAKLIGTGPNQVPTNGDLGSMAFEDKKNYATTSSPIYQPYRNIIINGDMSIAQRGTTETGITSSGYDTIDRMFTINNGSFGTWTQSQSTDVPTGQGFAKSLKMDCTTANTSPGTAAQLQISQFIEGQNLQYLKKGTANAESLTLSFWVKSNKTGTYIAELFDGDNSRTISKSYTIDSASTWEKKIITFEGDTTGTLDNDNAASFYIDFFLSAGTSFTSGTLATSWESFASTNIAVGQVNLADNTANEWYITGVQLEVGDSATPFEHLPYDVNLQRCQRYYQRIQGNASDETGIGMGYANGTTQVRLYFPLFTTMRTEPSFGENLVQALYSATSITDISLVSTFDENINTLGITFAADTGSPFTLDNPILFRLDDSTSAFIEFGAEL